MIYRGRGLLSPIFIKSPSYASQGAVVVGAYVVVSKVSEEAIHVSPVKGIEILRGSIFGDSCFIMSIARISGFGYRE